MTPGHYSTGVISLHYTGKCCYLRTHGALPYFFKIHNSIHLNFFIYCAKEHFLCFCFKYNAKTYAICTEFHINQIFRRKNFIKWYWWNTKPDCTKHSFINWYIHRHMSMVYFKKLHSEVQDLHNATTFGSHRLQ
jgi:hypothetical protein